MAVAAGACATPVGAFDDLNAVADVCERYGVWLHVDAAHGGAAAFSETHRHLLAGVERADSVIWDAHKMLFVPALCAFVFYKNRDHRFEAFRQDAPYLFDPSDPGLAEHDGGMKTLECTKRAAALGLWGTWATFGEQLFADLVDVTYALARSLYEKLDAAPRLRAAQRPAVQHRRLPARPGASARRRRRTPSAGSNWTCGGTWCGAAGSTSSRRPRTAYPPCDAPA